MGAGQEGTYDGAHVVAKRSGIEAVAAYVKVLADEIATDLRLGPFLFGLHAFLSAHPEPNCRTCVWLGATIAYGLKAKDFDFGRVDTCIFNALLFHRRGLSGEEIVQAARTDGFLRGLLEPRHLVASAVKMRITRIRNIFTLILAELGAPFTGKLFLPYVSHGHNRYRLAGNWHLVHVRANRNAA